MNLSQNNSLEVDDSPGTADEVTVEEEELYGKTGENDDEIYGLVLNNELTVECERNVVEIEAEESIRDEDVDAMIFGKVDVTEFTDLEDEEEETPKEALLELKKNEEDEEFR
ncbi:hypothetical protein Smp_178300 [Schistosoma mansoni]|uniref:Uncharacterized protein n=1 Tax=Schistosoma mansoni TaxID=6183 RepID=G4VKN0_SCHMA|nr:hypothetical protein Smp_178300 [Schistosoma mansoni]|eukprot:XP_018652839.1 hypothetical protein Smp_178300 [Schistosoma mansoni]